MNPPKDLPGLLKIVRGHFAKSSSYGIGANVSEVMDFLRKETCSPDESWLAKTTVELINYSAKDAFLKVPLSQRVVFIPHCMRNIKSCKAKIGEDGYQCLKCGDCKIHDIVKACEKRNIKWYMVGGGSQLMNIIKKYKPKAVIGIACFNEVKLGFDQLMHLDIPGQAVLLSKSGCVNTDVDLDDAFAKINM